MESSVNLRRLRTEDEITLAKLANNKRIWDNLRDVFPHPYTNSHARSFINMTVKEQPQMTFGIELNYALCGIISLISQPDVYISSAEIGYWIGEPYWNKGIATKSIELITHYGFHHLHLNRIFTGVFEHNIASMIALEKNGYKREGVFEKAVIKNGKLLDEYRYAILKEG